MMGFVYRLTTSVDLAYRNLYFVIHNPVCVPQDIHTLCCGLYSMNHHPQSGQDTQGGKNGQA